MVTVATLTTIFNTQGDADVSGKLNNLGQQVDAVGSKSSDAAGKTGALGTTLGAMGTAALGAFVGGVGAASNFQFQMSAVQAVTGATQAQMKGLSDQALDLSKNSIFSAQQVGVAQEEMAKAGLTVNDMMAGATEAVIQLAHATGGDLGQAATIAANALNQFGLSGADAGHVADVLTNAANTSALDVSDLGESLKYAAPAAHALGIGIEDTTAALSVMADQGLRGSRAGTDLKDVLLALAGPTSSQAAGLQQMGVNAFDANGKFVGLGNVIQQVADATKNMTDQQRLAILEQAFGKQGAQAMIDLLNSQTDAAKKAGKSWGDYVRNMNVSGSAAKQAATRLDNFQGSLLKLKQTLTVLGIQLGSVLLGPMRAVVDAIRAMLNAFLSLPQGVQQTIAAVGLVLSAFLALKSGFGGILPILGQISPGFAKMGESLAGLAPVLLGVAAAAGVFYLAYRTNFLGIGDKTRQVMADASKGIDYFKSTFRAARDNGVDPFNASLAGLTGAMVGIFGPNSSMVHGAQDLQKLGRYFTDVWHQGNTLAKTFNNLPPGMRGVARGLGVLVDTAHDFKAAWDKNGLLGVLHQIPFEFDDMFASLGYLIGAIPGMQGVGNWLVDFGLKLDGVWHGLGRTVEDLGNDFVRFRDQGMDALQAAFAAIGDQFPSLQKSMYYLSVATDILREGFGDLMAGVRDALAGNWTDLWSGFKQAATDALTGVGPLVSALGGAIISGLGDIPWGTIADTLRSGLMAALNAIGQLAGWVLDVGAPTLFGWILQAASWLGDKILGAVKAVAPVLSGWLLNVAAPTLFGWVLDAASWLGGKILDAVKAVAPELAGWTLNVGAPTLAGWIEGAVGWLSGEIKKVLPTGLSALAEVAGWVLNVGVPTVTGWVETAADWLYGYITGKLPATGAMLGNVLGWTLDVGAPTVTGWVEDTFDWLYGYLSAKLPAAGSVLADLSGWAINVGVPELAGAALDLASTVKDKLQAAVDKGKQYVADAGAIKVNWSIQLGPPSGGVSFGSGFSLGKWVSDNFPAFSLPDFSRWGLILGHPDAWGLAAGVALGPFIKDKLPHVSVDYDKWALSILPPWAQGAAGFVLGFSAGDVGDQIKSKIGHVSAELNDWVLSFTALSVDKLSGIPSASDIASAVAAKIGPLVIDVTDWTLHLIGTISDHIGQYGGEPNPTGPNTNGATPVFSNGGGAGGFGMGSSAGGIGLGSLSFSGGPASGLGAGAESLASLGQAIQPPDFSAFIAAFAAAGQQAAAALGTGLETALTAVTAVVSAIGTIASGLTDTLTAQGTASGQAWAVGLGAGLQLGLTATVTVTAAITGILAGWAASTTASGTVAGSGWAVGLGAGLQRGLSAVVATAAAIIGQLAALTGIATAQGNAAGSGWAVGLGAGLQRGLSAASATAGAIEGILGNLAGMASADGSNAGYGFAYGLGGGLNTALGAAAGTAGGIASILSIDLSGEGANAGYSFAAGLASAAGAAYGAAAAIAAAAVAGASTALGIASPSKVFRNLADQTVEGYLIPLQQRRGEVADSMATLMAPPRVSATDGVLLQTLSRSTAPASQQQPMNVFVLNADDFQRMVAATDGFFTLVDSSESKAISVRNR